MTADRRISPLFTWRGQARHDDRLNASARHVALALSLYMNEAGDSAFPAVATLAKDCARGKATILRALADLERFGWLEVDHVPGPAVGRTNRYRATVPDIEPVLQRTGSSDRSEMQPVLQRTDTGSVADRTGSEKVPKHVNTTPLTTELLKTGAARVDPNPYQPTPDQVYLAEKLSTAFPDRRAVDIPQLVRLNRRYGRTQVIEAQRSMGNDVPAIRGGLYGYLNGVCARREEQALGIA